MAVYNQRKQEKRKERNAVMNNDLHTLTTQAQVDKHYKGLGHAMVYGDVIIATNHVWSDRLGRYEYFAAIYDITHRDIDPKQTSVVFATESDEAFDDEGHAVAWAFGMLQAR